MISPKWALAIRDFDKREAADAGTFLYSKTVQLLKVG